jgi:asparagine synthetase B (glutamine-hydrolysing)
MIVSDREITTHAYYEIDTAAFGKSGFSFERAVETYRGLFEDSLSLHLRSDVEIAASLSGGMDSSAIVCSAHRQSGHGMRTFSSFYSDDPALDEGSG